MNAIFCGILAMVKSCKMQNDLTIAWVGLICTDRLGALSLLHLSGIMHTNVSLQADGCLQYIKFLSTSMSLASYAALLPPFGQLATQYGLPPEVVFAIYRPLLAGMHPPQNSVAEDGEIEGAAAPGGLLL